MRVRLKGLNSRRKKLADGTWKTYWYAWKGGPPVKGEYGSPEFIASYNEAAAIRLAHPSTQLQSVLQAYQGSVQFRKLAPRTKRDYVRHIEAIEKEFGDFPLKAMTAKRTRGVFMDWRDRLAERSSRQSDYAWTVLARVLSWALDRGDIDANPCEKGGRFYHGSRKAKVWSPSQEAAFLEVAPDGLRLAFLMALWTGQRQGDLLRLPWSAYDGTYIRLTQSKTGVAVVIPIARPLKTVLDRTPRQGDLILVNVDGNPWTESGFRSSWRKACIKAGVTGRTFHDLRGTAVTRLGKAGCTVPEIATITGHSLEDVHAILDANYLDRDTAMAESGIRKLERAHRKGSTKGTKIPD
ncbi:tyrosine-type recombinase/integrase [Microvirga aerilata]|uniref:Tyrosine-type recombinase/integrase n=1 Tax=Microvirga aerilata TaxID=670292 RepID=A0A936Z892_9HYPH|nr:tyrosine-type recombinase/integrase [Microvirga aerilata]MBL0405486.1 tyrosine-type recombinase/integrase [Microvirga aerilata]